MLNKFRRLPKRFNIQDTRLRIILGILPVLLIGTPVLLVLARPSDLPPSEQILVPQTPFPKTSEAPPVPLPVTPPSPPKATQEQNSAPAPVGVPARSNFGFSAGDLPGLSPSDLGSRLDDMKSMGIGWVRFDMEWSYVQEKGSGSYNWDQYDRVIEEVNRRGLGSLAILDYTPAWARVGGCNAGDACAPRDVNQFANFAAAAVNRYKGKGLHAWEIWNEPNTAGAWAPTPNAAVYTSLLKATYPAIKKADPNATVITGGMGVTYTEGGEISPRDFITGIYASGGKDYFDAVAQHSYTYPAIPAAPYEWTGWTQMLQVRNIMVANGDANKLLWITEYGAPTRGPEGLATTSNHNYDGNPDHVDEIYQAQLIAQATALYKTYSWTGPLFWYGYKDLGTDEGTNENFFGVVRYDGSRKPAYYVLKQVISAIR